MSILLIILVILNTVNGAWAYNKLARQHQNYSKAAQEIQYIFNNWTYSQKIENPLDDKLDQMKHMQMFQKLNSTINDEIYALYQSGNEIKLAFTNFKKIGNFQELIVIEQNADSPRIFLLHDYVEKENWHQQKHYHKMQHALGGAYIVTYMKKTDNGKKFLRLRLFNSISDI